MVTKSFDTVVTSSWMFWLVLCYILFDYEEGMNKTIEYIKTMFGFYIAQFFTTLFALLAVFFICGIYYFFLSR